MPSFPEVWYIVKTETGQCQIVATVDQEFDSESSSQTVWGPYSSREDAIARRVGLIRSGKCLPA